MDALILAAGYATRLYPLTLEKAKPLLTVGGKPIIEWVVDNLAGVPDLETIYVVTNDKFAADFQAWSERYRGRHPEFKFKIINDGSKSDDATGLVGCDMQTGHLVTLAAWEKPDGPLAKDWEVDRNDVDRIVRQIFETRNIVAFFADVREFESYVDAWAQDFGDRLVIQATTGRNAHSIAWDMRTKSREFTEACNRAEIDIREKDLTHDGDSRLQRHVLHARRRPNKYGVSIGKEGRGSPKKIDLAVCAIGARMVRRLVLASPDWAKRQKKRQRTGRVHGFA